MATFGRARRAPGSGNAFLRPFAGLLVVSLALLLLRDTAFVRSGATFVTELLVPAERVLGQVGSTVGVLLDDVVISDQGVVGRVSEVGNNYSKVLLVTDSSSAVSALVQGSRAAGIVRGQFGDTLVMDWILQTEDVKIGDVVITAGLAIGNDLKSLYPKGLSLGRVVEVTKGENGTFQRAILTPAVDLRHLENALVVNTNP